MMQFFEDARDFMLELLAPAFELTGNALNAFSGQPIDSDNFVFSALGKIVDFTGIITDLLGTLVDGVGQVLVISAEVAVSVGRYVQYLPPRIQEACVPLLSLLIALCVVRWMT